MDDCLIVAASFSWTSLASWWAIAQMALGLGAVIFVHELGHFLVAKACGVKCEKFYLGFDAFDIKIGRQVIIPRSLLKWTWGETQYGIGILPLGGYVKMLGQDDNPSNIPNERKRSHEPTHEVSAGGLDLEETAVGPLDRSKLDPRSYQAKTVLQRMAIISAGVIMNLIFSVIFATIAFRSGVNYAPAIIGQTNPGGPAYAANLDGAEILKVNDVPVTDTYYTFEKFSTDIVFNGPDQPIKLEMRVPNPDGEGSRIVTKEITPVLGMHPIGDDLAAIGVSPAMATKLSDLSILPEQAISKATPPLEDNDLIIAIDDVPVSSLNDMRRILAGNFDRPAKFLIERLGEKPDSPPARIESMVPTNPVVEFGFAVEMGPIRVIQEDSPAAQSGLKVGDIIETIDGQAVGDPFRLSNQMLEPARSHRSVRFGVRRLNAANEPTSVEVEITPRMPRYGMLNGRMLVAVDSLGLAFAVTNKVATVEPGGPGEQAGIQIGDEIFGAKILLSDELKKQPLFQGKLEIEFEAGAVGWIDVFDTAQIVRPPQPIEIAIRRDGKPQKLVLTPQVSTDWFSSHRGMLPPLFNRTYRASSWWEAIKLGAAQTRGDMLLVLTTLKKLVRGEVAIKHIGGPGTIAAVATGEATQGFSRLLLFLTMLGANLAILNFLPIPILDGGHMMFLAYEGIFRRPVNERVQVILSFMGLFFIIGLMVLAISLDISRYLF